MQFNTIVSISFPIQTQIQKQFQIQPTRLHLLLLTTTHIHPIEIITRHNPRRPTLHIPKQNHPLALGTILGPRMALAVLEVPVRLRAL